MGVKSGGGDPRSVGGVKSYVNLGFAALREHDECSYRLWLLLRHLDTDGRGWVTTTDLAAFVAEHDLWHPQSTWRHLKAGQGRWWWQWRDMVFYAGLQRTCDRLDAYEYSNPVLIPVEAFRSIGKFRAALLASMFAKKARTISLATLSRLTGRSRRTVASWAKRAKLDITENVMLSDRPAEGPVDPDLARQGYRRAWIDGEWRLVRRLPNTYHAPDAYVPTAHGQVKHIAKPCFSTRRAPSRFYFTKPTAVARALRRLTQGEVVYSRGRRTDDGAVLWRGYTYLNAQVVPC